MFVAEKSGLIKVFDNLSDPSATVFADLNVNVYNFWDRGLLGLALDPNFPATPYIYVLYTYDAEIGGTAPKWGTPGVLSDPCPNPPGATSDGCVVSGRLSRLEAAGNVMTGVEKVLIEDWCQQYPSHSVGALAFGRDGALYVSAGDGASFTFTDWGQDGNPVNPCGDPPGGVGAALSPPTAEGGALRSQDLRTSADPTGLDGTILRVDPTTGAGMSGNPLASSSDANARRIIATGLRNPFRFAIRPGTDEIWLGDVGQNDYEEINRVANPTDATVDNFGWPCYEGSGRQPGYDAADLALCESLYAEAGAVTAPYFSYAHSAKVVAGETCPTGTSSISGQAFSFYSGGPYPAAYDGALFFADYSRDCIWAMKQGTNGLPAPGRLETFVDAAANPVDVQISPAGELFYVDFDGGTIRRIRYSAPSTSCAKGQFLARYYNNQTLSGAPALERCEAAVNYNWGGGTPAAGVNADNFSVSWTGQFDFAAGAHIFTATADDGIRVFVDGSIVIDGWRDQAATTYRATRDLTAGVHEVKVEYYEAAGEAVAQVSWQAPTTPSCLTGQYLAQYFNNRILSGTPVVERCEGAINYAWGGGSPAAGVNADSFSVRWTGKFDFAAGSHTFTATADDGIRVWFDGNLLIDAWRDQAATTYKATRNITAGVHEVKVEYYEAAGEAVAKLSWQADTTGANTPPTATIAAPSATMKWKVGDAINFSGSATDAEDGALPPSSLTWSLILHHCPGNCHTHPLQSFSGVASGSFSAPDHEYPSHLELQLTAKDSGGATTTKSVLLYPETVTLTFASSPSGLQLVVNGASQTAPFTRTVITGSTNTISAPSPQTLGGDRYDFSFWTDGGAQTHNVIAAASTTYTATYSGPPRNEIRPTISGEAREGKTLTATTGSWSGTTPMAFAYQWLRCDKSGGNCVSVMGATGATYTLTVSDVGRKMRIQVTATNSFGSRPATSDPTATVKRAPG